MSAFAYATRQLVAARRTAVVAAARGVTAGAMSLFAAVVAGWLVAHDHFRAGAGLLVLAAGAAYVLRAPENGLILGTLIAAAVPYWLFFVTPQAAMPRLAVLCVVAGVVLSRRADARITRRSWVDLAAGAFVFLGFVSWLTHANTPKSFQGMLSAVLPAGFYLGGRRFAPHVVRRLMWIVLLAGSVAALSVFFELVVLHRPLFASSDTYRWSAKGTLIFRPGGVYGSPPGAAAVLSMVALFAFPLLHDRRRRLLVAACLSLCALAVVLTFTRAGIIGFAIGATLYIALTSPRMLFRCALASVVIATVAVYVVLPRVQDTQWFQSGFVRPGDLAARQSYWRDALPVAENSPSHFVLGHGVNALLLGSSGLPGDAPPDIAAVPGLLSHGPHNQYIRTLLEEGLVGLIVLAAWFLGSILVPLRQFFRVQDVIRRRVLASSAAAVVSVAIVASANDALRHSPSLALFSLISGVAVSSAVGRADEVAE